MASVSCNMRQQVCRAFWQLSRSTTPAKRKCAVQPLPRSQFSPRPFSSSARARQDQPSPSRRAERVIEKIRDEGRSENDIEKARQFYQRLESPSQWQMPSEPFTSSFLAQHLSPEDQAEFEALPQAEKDQLVAKANHIRYEMEQAEPTYHQEARALAESEGFINTVVRNPALQPQAPRRAETRDLGYWGDDEEDDWARQEDDDDEWDESMMSSIAEGELELKREIREYMRITAWEMPLLSQYAKPFEQPTHATPLRFRYTTYMGEQHPAQKKVVVEFATKDIATAASLTEPQRVKLIKLAGPRYNPSTDVVRMSSDKFEYAAQNKRYLGDLVATLLAEAKKDDDMFDDIPLDFRHHKHTAKPQFPEQWKLTKQRVAELDALRQETLQQIAASEEVGRIEEMKKRERIEQLVAAVPLGRREPTRRSGLH